MVLELQNITRTFNQGQARLDVLCQASLNIAAGEVVALVGPSGSGKSTLLQLAGLLEAPDEGEIAIAGTATAKLSDAQLTEIRRTKIGFVYQFHHLLPEFSALENVVLPQMIAGASKRAAKIYATELLGQVGLSERLEHRPAQLSGGEQQRVAIARALANKPQLLLADEPTGNLDAQTADVVFDMLLGAVRNAGVGALIATHNMELAQRMDRVLTLKDGKIEETGAGGAQKNYAAG